MLIDNQILISSNKHFICIQWYSHMTVFLCWNLNNKPLQESLRRLAFQHQVDVLILSEVNISPISILESLNSLGEPYYNYARGECTKIKIFTRFSERFLTPIHESDAHRITIRHLKLPARTNILIVALHLPSKLFWTKEGQSLYCTKVVRLTLEAEAKVKHSRTIIVGDFNMNPFESGLISALGLNAVMSRHLANQRVRTIQGETYQYFYNPMWNFFGDETEGPPGTYHYRSSDPNCYHWNIFDQVLIRPDLLEKFSIKDLMILQSDGETPFQTKQGLPNTRATSDHFPILFELNL